MTTWRDTKHLQAFKSFVQAQPSDRYIDHRASFEGCAVGAYGSTIGVYRDSELNELFRGIRFELQAATGIENISRVIDRPAIAIKLIPSYGELSEFLNDPVRVFQTINPDWL
jgi:hypothetical protein